MNLQLTHYNSKFEKRNFPIVLVCDNISNAPNIGGLFRIADAFGIETLIFCGDKTPLGKRMKKTSRSTENYVDFKIESDIISVLEFYALSHKLIGLEITANSTPIHQYKLNTPKPIVLCIGNENFGLSKPVLERCDDIIQIDMFGHNSSMNVVQATGIALYEFTKQLQQ